MPLVKGHRVQRRCVMLERFYHLEEKLRRSPLWRAVLDPVRLLCAGTLCGARRSGGQCWIRCACSAQGRSLPSRWGWLLLPTAQRSLRGRTSPRRLPPSVRRNSPPCSLPWRWRGALAITLRMRRFLADFGAGLHLSGGSAGWMPCSGGACSAASWGSFFSEPEGRFLPGLRSAARWRHR